MSHRLTALIIFFLSVVILLSSAKTVYAQTSGASFALSPSTKGVIVDGSFTVNVIIKSAANKEVSFARAVMLFDPTELELTGAEAGDIFCDYPTDSGSYAADNEAGQIIITGNATGISTCPYPKPTTSGIVFATLTFKAKKTGTASLDFVYNGREEAGQTIVLDTTSPPQLFVAAPLDGSYVISESGTTPKPPPDLGADPRLTLGLSVVFVLVLLRMLKKKSAGPRVIATTEV
jgi:hypothetical protein